MAGVRADDRDDPPSVEEGVLDMTGCQRAQSRAVRYQWDELARASRIELHSEDARRLLKVERANDR